MIYRDECGFIAEVEPISAEQSKKGLSLTLRVVKTLTKPIDAPPESMPKDGETFRVWKSRNVVHHSWSISEY